MQVQQEMVEIKGVLISRMAAERMGELRCRHGQLYPDLTCAFCLSEKKLSRPRVKKSPELRTEKHGTDWTEEELAIFYDIFEELYLSGREFRKLRRTKKFKEAIEEAKQILERSTLSVLWHYKHMFCINDPRAGRLILEFKLNKSIVETGL